MSKARWDINSHAMDLRGAGVSPEQIEQTTELASERARLEFEEKEAEDPYCRVAKVIDDAAEEPDEKYLAAAMIGNLEGNRSRAIRGTQKVNALEKLGEDLGYALRESRDAWVRADAYTGKYESAALIVPYTAAPREIEASKLFIERILRGLGALEKNKKIDSLSSLPEKPDDAKPSRPYYDKFFNSARNLPTVIDGVRLDVDLGQRKNIVVKMNMDRLRKIIHFPES